MIDGTAATTRAEHAETLPARERLREPEQRRGGLGGLALLVQSFAFSYGDRGVRGEDLEQPAGPPRRTGRSRGSTARSRRSPGRRPCIGTARIDSSISSVPSICTADVVVQRVGRVVGLAGRRVRPVMPSPTWVTSSSSVSDSYSVSSPRKVDRPQGESVGLQEVDPAVVVVDQRPSSAVMASPIASTSSSAFSRVARACSIRSCATERSSCSSTVPLARWLGLDHAGEPRAGPRHPLMGRPVRAQTEGNARQPKPRVGCLFGHGYHVEREHHGRGDRGRSPAPVLELPRRLGCAGTSRGRPGVRAGVHAAARRRRTWPNDRPPSLAGVIVGAFRARRRRRPDDVAVRALNPTLAGDGYKSLGTVVETNAADSPFLVDSVTEELEARGPSVRAVIHPVIGMERGDRTAGSRASCTRARPSVRESRDALRDSTSACRTGARRRSPTASAAVARRRAARGARLRRDEGRGCERMIEIARGRPPRATRPTRSTRRSPS